jgi:hypothetical protein
MVGCLSPASQQHVSKDDWHLFYGPNGWIDPCRDLGYGPAVFVAQLILLLPGNLFAPNLVARWLFGRGIPGSTLEIVILALIVGLNFVAWTLAYRFGCVVARGVISRNRGYGE